MQGTKMPGSRGLSPAPSPLRTVRASFPAHGSSTLQASFGLKRPGHSVANGLCDTHLQLLHLLQAAGRMDFFRNPHLLFLLQKFSRFFRTKAPVGSLHPFRSGNCFPIQPVTGWRLLAPTSHTHSSAGIPCGLLPTVFCGDDWAYHVPLR
jgi:hypothetical protein